MNKTVAHPSDKPVADTMALLGQRWVLLIVNEALHGRSRFNDFENSLSITPTVLAEKLSTLVAAGIMARSAYQENGRRPHDEYRLTPKGWKLDLIVAALVQWSTETQSEHERRHASTCGRQCIKTGLPVRVAFIDVTGRELPAAGVTISR